MKDRDMARIVAGEDPFEVTLEIAERRDVPFHGPPSIPLERIHEAARKAQATPGAIFHARPPWTSRNRWGFSDCVSFTVYTPVPNLAQTIISSRSRYRIQAFVNLIAGLRAAGSCLDETFRTSQTYETAPLGGGRTAYFVGVAAIPGSRASI
ncbi:MAG: hypothetical protein ACREDF_11620 [Thermoplasmata archaeon]